MAGPAAILVAGMHRSGTSATAGALAKMGISLGGHLLAPGADNPAGYWENERAVDIHERLLADLQRSWDDVRALPPDWLGSEAAKQAASAIDALIADEFAASSEWAVKDPRLCRFLPLWIEAVRKRGTRPVVLFVVRPPAEVAASIAARNGWEPALSRMLWLRYLLEAEASSRGLQRTVVTYEALLRDPAAVLGAALERLDIAARPDQAMLREFVDRGGRHHFDAKQEEGDRLSALCEQVHASFERIAAGGGDWDELRVHGDAFQAAWRDWGGNVDAVAAMAAELRMQVAAGKVERSRIASELGAQVDWARDFVAKHDALEAERARLQSELTAQLRWSDQAVSRLEALEAERARIQSELTAQVKWSEEFAASRVAEQAEHEEALRRLEAKLAETDALVAAMLASRSWRLTRPVRAVAELGRRLTGRSAPSRNPT